MGINALTGPSITFGLTRGSTGNVQEYNEERGPDMSDCGYSLYDPRGAYAYKPGSAVGTPIYGWYNNVGTVDQAPGTISTNALALVTSTIGAVSFVIVLSSVNNSAVTTGVTMSPADGSSNRTVWAIDSTYAVAPRGLTYGVPGTVRMWDPTTSLQRQITIAHGASVDDTLLTYTIQGFDNYGFKVTETITGTSSTGGSSLTLTSRKTYKYIQSITAASTATINSTNIVIGVNDVYGFPLSVHDGTQVQIWSGVSSMATIMTAQSSYMTFASTATATSTTQDVRGTWSSSIASNSTQAVAQRVKIVVYPRAQDMNLMTTTFATSGPHMWLGVDQWSS